MSASVMTSNRVSANSHRKPCAFAQLDDHPRWQKRRELLVNPLAALVSRGTFAYVHKVKQTEQPTSKPRLGAAWASGSQGLATATCYH